jgi:diguanylate cyclase (GGDEF)-like protein
LKRAVLHQLQLESERAERLRSKTTSPDLHHEIERDIRPLRELLESELLATVPPTSMLQLSQFLKVAVAESVLKLKAADGERMRDEKFGILCAPETFLPDLKLTRRRCGLRRRNVVVAYLDIDEFGKFNKEHGETVVDRVVLPQFMAVLEAHAFGRGHAYRYGGDEYVILLVNAGGAEAVAALDALRTDIAAQEYPGIARRTTVSIGCCEIGADCTLTDREIEEAAQRAKNHAKRAGRNRVASYRANVFDDAHLAVVAPPEEA